jgi:hypothetical protein
MHFGTLVPDVDRWAALRTAARHEKKVGADLADVGVPVFVPLLTRLTRYASKSQAAEVPLFSGYVFCSEGHFAGNDRVPTATAPRHLN